MKCNKCGIETQNDFEVCPECGEPVAQIPEQRKIKLWQVILASFAALILLLCLTIAVWWSIAGVESFDEGIQLIVELFVPRENNLYYKDSYSVDDKTAGAKREKVVATIGDRKLTNGQLQIYYWMNVYEFLENYGYYAVYMGLDYTQPLDQQQNQDIAGTWQHFFLDEALTGWHNYQAMALMAEKEGITLSESMQNSLDTLRQTMATNAVQGGYSSIDALLHTDMGPGCSFDDYYAYTKTYYYGYMYFSEQYQKIDTSDAAIEAYFKANQATLGDKGITKDSGNVHDVRHILIEIEGGTKGEDGKTIYTDEEWEACRAKAQKLLDEWLAGEHTEETFAKLAQEHSADGGSKTNGGLYTGLDKDTNFVKEFVDWYMDENRKVGDYGLIKTDYGYHIMYSSDIQPEWKEECRLGLLNEGSAAILKAASEAYPMEVNYKEIVLGVVSLG